MRSGADLSVGGRTASRRRELATCWVVVWLLGPLPSAQAREQLLIHYIERRVDRPTPPNNEPPVPEDEGRVGAELGLRDGNATGRFVGLSFALKSTIVEVGQDIRTALKADGATSARFLVVNAPADDLLKLADAPEADGTVLLNVGAPDTRLREGDCKPRLLHVLPSRDMLTDALVQVLAYKRWPRILLVSGSNPGDGLYAEALRRSARKFGARIVAESAFDPRGADLRDTALKEFPVITRGAEHDVVAVADELGEFGASLVYNTASPRPVVGTQGLTPTAWGRPVEAWAAVQLQQRFFKLAGRVMAPIDWAGWMAVHAITEAATQLKSVETDAVQRLLLSDTFEVGGFKGRALSFRSWNGQLRQPVFVLWPGAVVAAAPVEGFLHRRTELDTLGVDQPETTCRAFGGAR